MTSTSTTTNTTLISDPLTLPCGVVLKHRLAKSCMSDSLGQSGQPSRAQMRLYERWALGEAALSCIGEVQVSPEFPEKPGNLVLNEKENNTTSEHLFRELAIRGTTNHCQLWCQLGHAGALAHFESLAPGSMPKGPSPLDLEELKCEGLCREEIQALPATYAAAARRAQELRFSGVMIHAGHGFLLSQFLSPLFNHRTDEYGGSVSSRCRLILEIERAIRGAVGPAFAVGIRINSSDLLQGGLTQEDALQVVQLLDGTSIDLIDISGGTYFPGAPAASDNQKKQGGPLFLEFAKRARPLTNKPLMLSGGFKTRQQAQDALATGAVDMIGVARGFCLDPNLGTKWTTTNAEGDTTVVVDPVFPRFASTVAGGVTAWYTMRLTAIGEDLEDSFDLDLATALKQYDDRDAERSIRWKQTFYQSSSSLSSQHS